MIRYVKLGFLLDMPAQLFPIINILFTIFTLFDFLLPLLIFGFIFVDVNETILWILDGNFEDDFLKKSFYGIGQTYFDLNS